MRRPGTNLFLAMLLILSAFVQPSSHIASGQQEEPVMADFIPGQLIISFKLGVTAEEIAAFYQEYNLTEMDDLNQSPVEEKAIKLAFVPVDITESLLDTIGRDPRVEYAEPNYVLQISDAPDDPDYSKLWGLNNTGQTGGVVDADVDAQEAWDVTSGSSSVVVAVIDTGVDYTHEDLIDNMWVNPGECPDGTCEADGQDNDGNGYIDDFHGINAINDTGDPMDDYGHGTHVAGTIGATGDNGTGVVGVNWDVKIVACKFLGASGGGSVAGAVKCFNYVNDLKQNHDVNLVATNNSWGGSGASQALEDAMQGPDQPLHICAAGNANSSSPHYPASFDLEHIISVAATDHSDLYAGFSNYGETVDLAAPGAAILSTVPTGSCALCDPSGYATIGGTSMATPHVTGAVALIAAEFSDLTPVQIRQRILTSVDPLTDDTKFTITNGRLNIFNTLEEDETPPAAVSDLTVNSLLLTQVVLSWTATGDDGTDGNANSYDIRYSTQPISPENWDNATEAIGEPKPEEAGTLQTFAVSGLTPETTYYFAMKVVDNVGNASDLSNIVIGKTATGSIVFEDDMEDGPGDWTAAGTHDLWHISEHRSNSPTHAWYYGDEDTKTYDTGSANSGTLTSPPIELTTSDDVLLTYYEWSEVENSTTYDRTRLQVSTDGTVWETVFESHGTDGDWIKRTVSLTPYVGDSDTIHVRFWFDTIDNRFNAFEGWYIDDVQVLVASPTQPGEGPAQPNLVIPESNIGFSVPEPMQGESVTIYAILLNNGSTEASDIRVQFMDITGPSPVPIGSAVTLGNIGVGGSATAQVTYDTTGKAGDRLIEVVVDPFNLIQETNESDNVAQKSLTVGTTPAANLVIRSANIGFNPQSAVLGDQVTVNAVVQNEGAVEVTDVLVQFLDVTESGVAREVGSAQTIDILPAGGSAAVQVTYDTSIGDSDATEDRDIRVVVDPQNAIPETDEDDNDAEATLEMEQPPLPDLAVSSSNMGFDPAEPRSGETVTIAATIFNEGLLAANDVLVQFTDVTGGGAVPIGEPHTVNVIPAGSSAVVRVAYPTRGRAGDRKIRVEVDPQNFISEASESDNSATGTLSITPPPAPNLVMLNANIGIEPSEPVQGTEVMIRAVVLNTGNTDVEGVTVQFLDVTSGANTPIGEGQLIAMIAAGGSAVAEVPLATEGLSGERRIQVVVDPSNFIAEANEEDNSATRLISIVAPAAPNLLMTNANILFDPAQPTQGDQVTITAVVLNNGSAPAERVLVQFVDVTNGGFEPIGEEQTIESVPVGGSATAHVTYSTSGRAGARKIQVLLDSNNLIDETNETDNDALTTLSVDSAAVANLVVFADSIGFQPVEPTAGETVTVTVTIHNQGTADARDVTVQLLDISSGEPVPVGQPMQLAAIPAGGASVATMTYPVQGESGQRHLRVVVDPSNFIPESDETDNRASAELTVTPGLLPNLAVLAANIGFDPVEPDEGSPVTVSATLMNNGTGDAVDVLVQFVDITGGGAEPIGAKQTVNLVPAGGVVEVAVTYETTGKPGERRIRVVVDPHMTVPETSELDNEAVAVLFVEPAPLPNLVARENNIGFSQPTPDHGDVVTVTATIFNAGDAAATDVMVQFVEATAGASFPIAANQVIAEIPAGSAATAQIAYDTTGRPGTHKIQVIVDPNNLIVESDENDNRATGTLEVRPSAFPNLTMRSTQIGFDPAVVQSGDSVEIYATVLNSGMAAAGEIMVQFLDISGSGSVSIGDVQLIDALAPGASAVVQTTYVVPADGERRIQVVVDPNNTIFESSETDNSATGTLEPVEVPLPNLAMLSSNIGFSRAEPVEGEDVVVTAVVLNNGAADVGEIVVQFLDVTDSSTPAPIGPQQMIAGIPAGGSAILQVTYSTQGVSGERSIKVEVDPNNFIEEEKETDNSATASLDVVTMAVPNLLVLPININFSPPDPTAGDPVVVRAVVLNHGKADAHDVVIQFLDESNGSLVPIGAPQTVARIPAGSGILVQATFDTGGKQGERTIQVIADPNNFIVESDEDDNRASKPLVVGAPAAPNLVALASNIEFDPAEPNDGDIVTIEGSVLNNGTDAALDVVVRFVDITDGSPVLIDKQRLIDSVAPGEASAVQVTYDTTDLAGDRKIQMIVDPGDTVAESDETDNSAMTTLTVAPPPAPNLTLDEDDITISPESPTEGTEVTINITVHNNGTAIANNVSVAVDDVTNGGGTPIGSTKTIASIPAGGTGTTTVLYDTTGKAGERTIRVSVDPNELIPEQDETDNEAEAQLTVAPPSDEEEEEPGEPGDLANLTISSGGIVFEPAAPEPGQPVTITAMVSNTGGASASEVIVRFLHVMEEEEVQIGDDATISSIAAGGSDSASVELDTTDIGEEAVIKVLLDPENTIEESDEDDNEATATLVIGGSEDEPAGETGDGSEGEPGADASAARPNLVIRASQVSLDLAQSTEQEALAVALWVRNEGIADADNVRVVVHKAIAADESVGHEFVLDYVPAGGSARAELIYESVPGDNILELTVTVDPDDQIREASEQDNQITTVLAVP